jgi:hypothetical protein
MGACLVWLNLNQSLSGHKNVCKDEIGSNEKFSWAEFACA